MFSFEHAWLAVVSAFSLICGFVLNGFKEDLKEARGEAGKARDELAAHKIDAAKTYMPREEVSKQLEDIRSALDEIKDRLPPRGVQR